jgi:hypothetical protein
MSYLGYIPRTTRSVVFRTAVNTVSNPANEVQITAGEATISLSYELGYLDVYKNGSRLEDDGTDFIAIDGLNVEFTGLVDGDKIVLISYSTLSLAGSGGSIDMGVLNTMINDAVSGMTIDGGSY